MTHRALTVLLVALSLGALALALERTADPAVRSAARLQGERWYRLMLNEQQVGFMHTLGQRDPQGRWIFSSDLRFVLNAGSPVGIQETLAFGPFPPFPLLWAAQRQQTAGHGESTLIRRGSDGYELASIRDAGSATGQTPFLRPLRPESREAPPGTSWQPASWTYGLPDYLEFEAWLLSRNPDPGTSRVVTSLDFARRDLVSKQFRVVARNGTGYLVEHAAPLDSSRIQLNSALAPESMTLSGIFLLERVPETVALAPRTALQTASYFVPTDRPLPNHQNISALDLEIQGAIPAATLWPKLLADDDRTLRLSAGTVSRPAKPRNALRETATFPVADPRIRRLAREAVSGAETPADQVAALTSFVHGYLSYREGAAPKHVMALLDDPTGDCSEYADLFTTLARSLEIPSRTVFGLAYADETPPAFRFHAWNEVFRDGTWHLVDPTWNQLEVDATHIPLPEDTAVALKLLTGGGDLRFVVRDVTYR